MHDSVQNFGTMSILIYLLTVQCSPLNNIFQGYLTPFSFNFEV